MSRSLRFVGRVARASVPLLVCGALWGVEHALAGSLGAPQLDAFLTQFRTGVEGAGATAATVGLLGYAGSLFDNPFSTLLSGSVNWITKAGMLGGGTAIVPALGLAGGATL